MTKPVEISPGITIDAGVHHGKPVVKGTRVPVALVLGQLAAGVTHAELEAEFDIDEEGIRSALRYATDLVASQAAHLA